MAKQLKIWNGRGHGKYDRGHVYVAAYSAKQAVELINQACSSCIGVHEINVYYAKGCWGNPMDGITPTEPCVYVQEIHHGKEKPFRII